MALKKSQIPILVFTLAYILVSAYIFIRRGDSEFIYYVAGMVLLILLLIYTGGKFEYPDYVLWGLSVWGLLHILGGSLSINRGQTVLYDLIIVRLSSRLPILRYDQLVHVFGFFFMTLLMWAVLRPLLKPNKGRWAGILIIVVLAGLGTGAMGEILEFLATVVFPKTLVGDYVNNSLDLVSDLIGALLAASFIWAGNRKK
jgi:hypothetical protein